MSRAVALGLAAVVATDLVALVVLTSAGPGRAVSAPGPASVEPHLGSDVTARLSLPRPGTYRLSIRANGGFEPVYVEIGSDGGPPQAAELPAASAHRSLTVRIHARTTTVRVSLSTVVETGLRLHHLAAVPAALVAATGDIACSPDDPDFNQGRGRGVACRHAAVAAAIRASGPDLVLPLGDLQYETGTAGEFRTSYDRTWGSLRDRTRPVPGNHEYRTEGAGGYFGYFGRAAGDPSQGWYSFRVAGWTVVALNSECGGAARCDPLAQRTWLREQLRSRSDRCVLALAHRPAFSSGLAGPSPEARRLWSTLADEGASVLLSGHDHDYERFVPLDRNGKPSPRGMRQFVVGTGGAHLRPFLAPQPGSAVRRADQVGYLQLLPYDGGYDWTFVPVAGGSKRDSGTARCA